MNDLTLPIKPLPMVERWDCAGCARCCRGSLVPLDDDDLQRLRSQHWDRHPEYRGIPTVSRQGLFRRRYHLAQRDDGSCVFLTDQGRCRIHQDFGFDAKPLVCRMYPLQLVPVDQTAWLTLRRSCPTAAADRGREVVEYRDEVRRYVREHPPLAQAVCPPAIRRGLRRSWQDTLLVTDAIENLLTDSRYPLVRRLVHGLKFCALLAQCRIKKQDGRQLAELVKLLAGSGRQEVAEMFRQRAAPGRAAAVLFRQVVADYLRLHPRYVVRDSWRERVRLAKVAMAFARGRGPICAMHDSFPEATFETLEASKLGHLSETLQQPLLRYFETMAVSKQYAVISRPEWPLVEKFQALAIAYPVALWMLRYFCGEREPAADDVIDILTALDRGQAYGPLIGGQHRRRISQLATLGELERLAIWYAR